MHASKQNGSLVTCASEYPSGLRVSPEGTTTAGSAHHDTNRRILSGLSNVAWSRQTSNYTAFYTLDILDGRLILALPYKIKQSELPLWDSAPTCSNTIVPRS